MNFQYCHCLVMIITQTCVSLHDICGVEDLNILEIPMHVRLRKTFQYFLYILRLENLKEMFSMYC